MIGAMTLGLVVTNAARPVKSLRHVEAELTAWTAEEITAFTATTLAEGCDYHALFYLVLTAGPRAGELLALEWADLTGDRLHITRTSSDDRRVNAPKSRAGNRLIALPSDTVETIERHRVTLAAAEIRSPYVFPTGQGTMANHSNIGRTLHSWADRLRTPLRKPQGGTSWWYRPRSRPELKKPDPAVSRVGRASWLARRVGFEPTTNRLTADRSATELPPNVG